MSKLFKSNYIFVGEPLEIKENTPAEQEEHSSGMKNTAVDVDRIKRDAVKIVERARKEAEGILKNAEDEAAVILKKASGEGYKAGYTDGIRKGRQQGLDTASRIIEEAVEIRQRVNEEKERAVKEAEQRIVEIVIEIAKKVIEEQIQMDRELILGPVRKALEKCSFSKKVIMRVAPEDYEIVSLSKNRLLLEVEGVSEFEITMENTLSPGSCILETDSGYINSSIDVQLDRIEKCFKELLDYEKAGS